ncbi:MAG: hypothetical protein EXS14_07705 [Planctomycetes bacterium]|nr:hypothetical protein [Planctomycetota bacterium]
MTPRTLTLHLVLVAAFCSAGLKAQETTSLAQAVRLVQDGEESLAALDEAKRVEVLLLALKAADDSVARQAAARLHYLHLDAAQCERVATLLFPAVLSGEGGVDMEQWRSLLGSVEAGAILRAWKEWPRGAGIDLVGFFGILHRAIRAEHIPLLLEIAKDKADPDMAEAALREMCAAVLPHTDRQRTAIARVLLIHAGVMPPAGGNGSGLDPLLRALLELVHNKGPDSLPRGCAGWLCRWLLESEGASLADLAALQHVAAMAQVEPKLGLMLALACVRAAAGIKEAKASAWLESLVANEGLLGTQALASLAQRGDSGASTALMRRATDDAGALAWLCAATPDAARQLLARIASPADATQAKAAAQQLAALAEACEDLSLPSAAALVATAVAPLFAAQRHGALLARVGSAFPECATRPLALAAIAALLREGAPREDPLDFAESTADFAFLECRVRDELVALLRGWSQLPKCKAMAVRMLVRMGEGTSAEVLLASNDDVSEAALRSLSADETIELRTNLIASLNAEFAGSEALGRAMRWLAVLGGVTNRLASAMADCERSEETDVLVRGALAEGRVVDAVVALLPHLRAASLADLGLVQDARVQNFLCGLRDQRETKFHAIAVGELARGGDVAAQAELRSVILAGRYRWLDNEEGFVLSLGLDVREAAWWMQELESNCCRTVVARRVLKDLFGWDLPALAECVTTDAALVRRRFAAASGRFSWSAIAGHLLPAP